MEPTSGKRAIAQIQIIFRPVLITCTIKPAWTAMDRIGMRYNGESPGCAKPLGFKPGIVARTDRFSRDRVPLALRYANPALHVTAVGPPDVRQGITQYPLGARIDGDFHFAAVKTGRSAGRLLRKKPDVHPLLRCLVDFTRFTECVLQSAHRFPDIVRGNARHRTQGIPG